MCCKYTKFGANLRQKCDTTTIKTQLDIEISKHYNTWRRYAHGLMKNTTKGDDLLSETLLKVLENQRQTAEQMAETGKLLWYVNKSLYNNYRDMSSRYNVKYTKYSIRWDDSSQRHNEFKEQPWLGSRIDNEYLDSYIMLMPEIDAVMLRLYILDGFSYKEVSDKTGIPVKHLYRLVENAIKKIKNNVVFQCTSAS